VQVRVRVPVRVVDTTILGELSLGCALRSSHVILSLAVIVPSSDPEGFQDQTVWVRTGPTPHLMALGHEAAAGAAIQCLISQWESTATQLSRRDTIHEGVSLSTSKILVP
jgi:hypothetical protein